MAVPRSLWTELSQTLCLCLDMRSLGEGMCVCEESGRRESGRKRERREDHSVLELKGNLESQLIQSFHIASHDTRLREV